MKARAGSKPDDTRPGVGDFIYCRSPYHREQLGIGKDAGLVLENKRSNYRVLYGTNQFCWLPEEVLTRIEGEVNLRTVAGRLHWILKRFDALDCELVTLEGVHRATFRVDRMDDRTVDELREMLGTDFVSLTLVPEGMAFMLAEVKFR